MGLDAERVHKPVRKLRKLLKKLPKQPNPEQVHQLRTNTRRLEAMLASLSLDSQRQERRLLKDLGQVRKKAGKVRDMDVLIGYVPAVPGNGDRECRVQLVEHLGDVRSKQAKKLHAVVSSRGQSARMGLKRVRRELEKLLCEGQDSDCDPSVARSHATASALTLESGLVQPTRLTRQNLHPYRLKVKQLQNILRLAEGSDHQEFLETLGNVKDAIGEWHDWEELLAIANDVLDHGSQCELIRGIKRVCNEKYEKAMAEALSMRRKYLRVQPGKTKGGLQHAAKPVWEATAAMAA